MSGYLYHDADLHAFLAQKRQELDREVLGFPRDYLLNASEEDLCAYLTNKYTLAAPIVLTDQKEILETRPIIIQRRSAWGDGVYDAQGQLIVLGVPFDGDAELFRYKPSTYLMRRLEASVRGSELVLQYEIIDAEAQRLEREIESDLDALQHNSANVRSDVTAYNAEVPGRVRTAVIGRKRTMLEQMNFVDALNIPIRRRHDGSQTYSVPTLKRKPRIERPAVSSTPFKPEPVLAMEEYQHILDVAQNMAIMLERSPSTFAKLDEEEIRDHFLVHFNGHYEGQATGETFNRNGKTDILIKEGGRNVFIAECKFWSGPKAFGGIIDQLLGYTSWRDTKTAIFLFNRNKDTSKVLEQIPVLVKSHLNFKREAPGRIDETRFRYVVHQAGDTNREIILTVCIYDIPSPIH